MKTRYQIDDFVAALADHTPEHYRHSVRGFGLLAPGSIGLLRRALFLLLGSFSAGRRLSPAHPR